MLFTYAIDENPKAELCFNLTAGGFLNAYSIGGVAKSQITRDSPDEDIESLPVFARRMLMDADVDVVYDRFLVLEVSAVYVGANEKALRRAMTGLKEMDLGDSQMNLTDRQCKAFDVNMQRAEKLFERMDAVLLRLETSGTVEPMELLEAEPDERVTELQAKVDALEAENKELRSGYEEMSQEIDEIFGAIADRFDNIEEFLGFEDDADKGTQEEDAKTEASEEDVAA